MAKSDKALVEISTGLAVRRPAREEAIPVPVPEWKRIMTRINNTGEKTSTYQNQGWACIGVAAGCAAAALSSLISVKFINDDHTTNIPGIVVEVVFVIAAIASALLARWSFQFADQHASDHAKLRQSIFDDMEAIELRHPPIPAPETTATAK